MNRSFLLMIAIFAAVSCRPQAVPKERSAVENYQAALQAANSGKTGLLEAAFSSIPRVSEALTTAHGNGGSVLESLSTTEFEKLRRSLPGLVLSREEVVFVKPDVEYLRQFAEARGEAADRAFFSTLKSTYPDSVWPIYVNQQTDYSGCTRFGSGALVDTYRDWTKFQNQYPTRYVDATRHEIDEILHELTESTCACGDMASVENELQRFLTAFPSSPLTNEINERLAAVRVRQSKIRSSCISG